MPGIKLIPGTWNLTPETCKRRSNISKLTLPPGRPSYPRPSSAPSRDQSAPRADSRPKDDGPRINRFIRALEVRVINHDGEMLGVLATRDALARAQEVGLDLVEVNPTAQPPVCKILDYGKYKYEEQKKKKEAKKKQKIIEVKEIKLRPSIDDHDLVVKIKQIHKFLDQGDKVKVSMRFRGREFAHEKIGRDIMARIQKEVADVGKAEAEPKMESSHLLMMLSSTK